MILLKWTAVFLISFAVAFVIIVTFSQPQFRVPVSALLFTYQTKPLPIWAYVGGALGFGLIIGLGVAAYYYITLRASIFKKDRQIKKLESELDSGRAISGPPAPHPDPAGDDPL